MWWRSKRSKDDAHRAEMEARRARRAERSARTDAVGPTPRNIGPKPTTTDAAKVKAAHDKRERRRVRRMYETVRTQVGRM